MALTKIPSSLLDTTSGLSLSGDITLADNDKAIFGASSDLQIYHDGSQSIITDVGTGQLKILAENTLHIGSATGTEAYIRALKNGVVELYYDNALKLTTASGGISVTGNISVAGAASDLLIIDNSATALTISEGSNDYLTFDTTDSAEKILVGKPIDMNGNALIFDVDGDTQIAGSPIDDMLIFKSGGTSWLLASASVGLSPNVAFPLGNSTYPFTHLYVDNIFVDGNTIKSTDSDGDLIFKGNDGGSEITALTLDMSDAGTAYFGHNVRVNDNDKFLAGTSADLQIYHDATDSYIQNNTGSL